MSRSPAPSAHWLRLCAEQLSGIADPLFPSLARAVTATGPVVARTLLAGLAGAAAPPASPEPLPPWLLPHQADAVVRARAILARFGGVLIADGVGLGKTFVGLALADLERAGGGDAIALVPSAIREDWTRAADTVCTPITLLTHEQLGRGFVEVPATASLVLVDEAHAFRNPRTRRYDALARLTERRRVALLTATPYNNSAADLVALLHLFAARDRFRELGVTDFTEALHRGTEGPVSLALGAVTVCRTRRVVESRFAMLRDRFPRRTLRAPLRYDLDRCYGGRLDELLTAIGDLTDSHGAHERAASLLHLTLLRRLESSRAALRRSLRRHRDFLVEVRRAAESGHALSRAEFRRNCPPGDTDDLQLVLWPMLASGAVAAEPDTRAAERAVERALSLVEESPADPKLAALADTLQCRPPGTRTLVFTEYRDTALYLLRQLRTRFRVIGVVGREGWASGERIARREALDVFAPGAAADPLLEADVLVATDVASEGLNLQAASQVLNYDLPWNPVRVMQRVGRIDRLGSPHRVVEVGHLVPGHGRHSLTSVLRRLRAKLHGMQRTIGPEPDPLAALWWLDEGDTIGPAVDDEASRRLSAFEAVERWRDHGAARRSQPVVGAVAVDDGGEPATGVLLEVVWDSGTRVPLAYVVESAGRLVEDPLALGHLAERALDAPAVPVENATFIGPLATVLGAARTRLIEIGASRHAGVPPVAEHRSALRLLERRARSAALERSPVEPYERAAQQLRHALTAGRERLVAAAMREGMADGSTVRLLLDALAEVPTPPDIPGRAPRLELVAALAVLTICPSR